MFLQAAGGLAVAGVARNAFAANSKLQHACIGVGGMMGGGDFGSFLEPAEGGRRGHLRRGRHQLGCRGQTRAGARTYTDWREMLEREGDRIDSVNVTVPDHMHAAISMAALGQRQARVLSEADGPRRVRGPGHDRGRRQGSAR